jgi:aminoglycoside phosphotransferase (APT) family kinase protein
MWPIKLQVYAMKSLQTVAELLNSKGWVAVDDPEEQISYLGAHWGNDNYVITAGELYGQTSYFLRLGRGADLGRMAHIEYEFMVLQALKRSGVSPRPFYCDESARVQGEPVGALLMEFLPGRQLVCSKDWRLAVQTLALVHRQPVDGGLVSRKDPLMDTCDLCARQVSGMPTGLALEKARYVSSHLDTLRSLTRQGRTLLMGDEPVVTHGSVRPSDFIVDEDRAWAWLVDWENGAVSSRYSDLGMFMAVAARDAADGFCRTHEEKMEFLDAYVLASGLETPLEVVMARACLFQDVCVLQEALADTLALCYLSDDLEA